MSNVAGQIDSFLRGYGSPMAGLGSVYVAAGKKYGVDPRLPVAISIAESSGGKHLLGSYNAWGWGPGIPFSNWQEGISAVTKGLASGYINQGLTTPAKIANKWAPASDGNDPAHWSSLVGEEMRKMGASPAMTTSQVRAGPAASANLASSPSSSSTPPANTQQLDSINAMLDQLYGTQQAGLQSALMSNLGNLATRHHASPNTELGNLLTAALSDQQTQRTISGLEGLKSSLGQKPLGGEPVEAPAPASTQEPSAPAEPSTPTGPLGKVTVSSGADRPGVSLKQPVIDFVEKVAGVHGTPLVITTGTNHNQYVANSNPPRESAHWTGNAADIMYGHGTGPNDVDPALTKLGQDALIAAGMPEAEARKQTGGLYNLPSGYQIIFNSYEGGNHYNHLHVGLR